MVQICIDEEHSFNHSPCETSEESLHENVINSNCKLTNTDLLENNINKACPETLQNHLSESEHDLSFKSVNDTLTNNLVNKVSVRESILVQKHSCATNLLRNVHVDNKTSSLPNDNSTQSDKISTQSSKLTDDKDGYETCIDESLSEDVCIKVKSVHRNVLDLTAHAQYEDVCNKTDITEVQNFYAEDKTPTNSPINRTIPEIARKSGNTFSVSEPCLNFDVMFSKNNHICLDNKLDDDLKSYDNQDDSAGTDEFFLVQYPENYFSNVSEFKSRSAPIGFCDSSKQEFTSFVQYKQYLTEYYTNYQTYGDSCREYSQKKKTFSRRGTEEITDDEIFDDILLPFRHQSAPSVSDSTFISPVLYDGLEKNRRKSAFESGFPSDTDK